MVCGRFAWFGCVVVAQRVTRLRADFNRYPWTEQGYTAKRVPGLMAKPAPSGSRVRRPRRVWDATIARHWAASRNAE